MPLLSNFWDFEYNAQVPIYIDFLLGYKSLQRIYQVYRRPIYQVLSLTYTRPPSAITNNFVDKNYASSPRVNTLSGCGIMCLPCLKYISPYNAWQFTENIDIISISLTYTRMLL